MRIVWTSDLLVSTANHNDTQHRGLPSIFLTEHLVHAVSPAPIPLSLSYFNRLFDGAHCCSSLLIIALVGYPLTIVSYQPQKAFYLTRVRQLPGRVGMPDATERFSRFAGCGGHVECSPPVDILYVSGYEPVSQQRERTNE